MEDSELIPNQPRRGRPRRDEHQPGEQRPGEATAAGLSRRRFLRGAAATAGLAAAGGAAFGLDRLLSGGAAPPRALRSFGTTAHGEFHRFRSRPDLAPPVITVTGGAAASASGLLLLGPGSTADRSQEGPMIVGPGGDPVWFHPLQHGRWAAGLAVSSFRREPVLAWWEGKVVAPGFGQGEAVIADREYRTVRRVRAGNRQQMDLHEFSLTPEGTALFTCFPRTVPMDLTSIGGPADGRVQESVFQELDVASGRVLLEWHSLDHVPVSESYKPLGEPYDYLHVNSIDVAPDGNLLVSARHTWSLYKVDRSSGAVIWRLGGKRSDFELGSGARFAWQHDARMPSASRITLFDDGSDGPQTTERQSRGLVLDIDEAARRAQVAESYRHPRPLLASAMGSFQTLPGGGALVGWGTASATSEFSPGGRLLSDARLPSPLYSYRARRSPWRATPAGAPALAVQRARRGGPSILHVSWNGATDVARWVVHRGSAPGRLERFGTARRAGFETSIALSGGGYVAVTGVDAAGAELGRSPAVSL